MRQQSIAGKEQNTVKRKKGPEVTMETRMAVIQKTAEFKSGEFFTVAHMQCHLANYGCSSEAARSALEKMHKDYALVDKDYVQVRSRRSARYRRAKSSIDWLAVPWRKRSNEGLGIRPDRLGVMGR